MFAASRFIAVDDKDEHLRAIVRTFESLGTPCMGIRFDPAKPLEASMFRGVRALFLDLHLITGTITSDEKQHFANIASILEENISEGGGPFILVLWTEHPQHAPQLIEYLDEKLDDELPWSRPLAVVPMSKDKFINIEDGSTKAAEELRAAIEEVLTGNPQLAALIDWETDVLRAAGETLASLTGLVPKDRRNTEEFPGALDVVLSRLAVEAVGKKHVPEDPRAAVTSALAPILADRIVNQQLTDLTQETWKKAVTKHTGAMAKADEGEAGSLNRMLHVAVMGSERIVATDWGAVSELPADMFTNDALEDLFGMKSKELLGQEFKIGTADRSKVRPRLIRVGAICDYAQKKAGPIPFIFALEIPCDVERKGVDGQFKPQAAEWQSPTLLLPGGVEPFTLNANSRFEITRPAAACANWKPVYRLREQLLMQLITHATSYVARPGIVRIPAG